MCDARNCERPYDVITNDDEPKLLCFTCYNRQSGVSEKQRKEALNDRKSKATI